MRCSISKVLKCSFLIISFVLMIILHIILRRIYSNAALYVDNNLLQLDQKFKLKNFTFSRIYLNDSQSALINYSTERIQNLKNNSSRKFQVGDLFLSVKTSSKYHKERLSVILSTWWNYVPNNVSSNLQLLIYIIYNYIYVLV